MSKLSVSSRRKIILNNKILLLTIPFILSGCGYNSRSDIQTYENVLNDAVENPDFHTWLYIFPKNTNIGTPTKFAYKSMDDLFTGSYFLYLAMTYDEENFNNELARLDKIYGHFSNGETKKILHYEEQSTYLTINKDNRYEYAIYDKENLEIAYVSNQLFSWTTARVEDKHTLPSLTIPSELDDGDNSYNMYCYYSDEPDGMGGTIHIGMYVDDESKSGS